MARYWDGMTLGEARQKLREHVGEGDRCPCCTQWAQVYRWSLYSTAVRLLIRMYHAGGVDHFVESKTIKEKGQGGDATRLRHWGLVEQESERREDGGKSGWWRVTPLGRAFVMGEATVPKYAYVFDGRCLKLDGAPRTIRDCLGKRFDYDELMAA